MKFSNEIDNSQDIIDSRNIIARIEELEEQREDLQNDIEELTNNLDALATDDEEIQSCKEQIENAKKSLIEWDESEGQELEALKALADQCEGYGDWENGESLLRDSYMDEEWAKQELEDLGYISNDLPYLIESNINWKGVLEDLQQDYMEVDFDGVTYWMRA